ncbi:MAG: hypothetical protein LBT55_03785 [Clostridiaceae bacterium]|jgi:hypothetical protein|nr:hypothetical protein [Clostridiaceae bacterium]
MGYKFLTPLQVWENFSPVKEPVELSIVKTSENDGVHISECFFTAETVRDGKVRGFISTYTKTDWAESTERHPIAALLPPVASIDLSVYLKALLDKGIAVAVINYAGASPESDKNCTIYPQSLAHGNFLQAGKRLHLVEEDSRDTTWFLWAKLARRALTALTEMSFVNKEKMALIGIGAGAQIAWQVAGVDGRLKAVMPLFGCGYTEYHGHFKYGTSSNIEMKEERKCWIAGTAPQSFAQFINCPLYFLTGSNSTYGDMDRAYDIVNFVPSYALMGISPMRDRQLGADIINSAILWLELALNGGLKERKPPELRFENRAGKLFLNVRTNNDILRSVVYFSENEIDPSLRTWEQIADISPADNGSAESEYEIPVYKDHGRVFAFANSVYKDRVIASSRMVTEVPSQSGIVQEAAPPLVERVIYTGAMGADGAFVAEKNRLFLDGGTLLTEEGPEGIRGVKADDANLVTYKLSKSVFAKDKTRLLNFSVYSKERRRITITLKVADDVGEYDSDVELAGLPGWQCVTLTVADFKNAFGKSLKEWLNVRKLTISNASGVLFNNFLWV